MGSPRLIHPIPVTIELINRDQLVKDGDAREAYHGARQIASKRVTMQAQHKVQGSNEPAVTAAGFTEPATGYILVRTMDLRRQNIVLKRGDRIVQIGRAPNALAMDTFLMLEQEMGHYPGQGGPTLVKWYYSDRAPGTPSAKG